MGRLGDDVTCLPRDIVVIIAFNHWSRLPQLRLQHSSYTNIRYINLLVLLVSPMARCTTYLGQIQREGAR